MPWDFALILLVLGVIVPWRSAARFRRLLERGELSALDRISLYASTIAFQWLAVAIVAWRAAARGVTAQELAVAVPNVTFTVLVAAALAVLVLGNQLSSLRRLARIPPAQRGLMGEIVRKLMPQTTTDLLAFLALVATVALCEEFLYRGFVFHVLVAALGGSQLAGAVASAALFAAAHVYQGWRGVQTSFLAGLIFAGARIWTGSLAPAIAAHFVADLLVGVAGPRMLGTLGSGRATPAPTAAGGADASVPSKENSESQ